MRVEGARRVMPLVEVQSFFIEKKEVIEIAHCWYSDAFVLD